MGTNRPIYGDRENGNKIHYDYEKISERERTSYGWQGDFGIPAVVAYYRGVAEGGTTPPSSSRRTGQPSAGLKSQVRRVIEALDERGRWLQEGMIRSSTFVQNVNLLCDYLQGAARSR